jgi:hypothetical protein
MKNLIAAVLLLGCGVAQAFTVTVNSVERSVLVRNSDGFFFSVEEITDANTGAWADVISFDDRVSAEVTASNVPDSGSYSLYELDMVGSLVANSSGFITSANAELNINVTFDTDMRLVLSCFDVGVFGGTSVAIDGANTGEQSMQCGDEVVLASGTHDLDFLNIVSANFGGSQTYDFDATLSMTASAVPIPAAVWFFGSALAGLGWFRRKTA